MPDDPAKPAPLPSNLPPSTARRLLVVVVAVFVAEFFVMWALEETSSVNGTAGALLDASVVLTAMVPLLYVLFVRPMARGIRQQARAENALRKTHTDLERRVGERTAELAAANESLRREALEHKRADERVRFQASLLDAVEQAVVAADTEGRIVYWNRFAQTLCRWGDEEVQGRLLPEVIPIESAVENPADVLSGCETDRGWRGELRLVRRDGTRFPADLTCSPVRAADGSLAGYVYAFLDITGSKEAEEALRYSEEKYSTLVENSPTGIFIYRDGKVVFANQKYLEMTGRSRSELAAVTPESTIHPDDWPAVQEIGRKRVAGEEVPAEYECRLVTPSGQVRWVSVRNALIPFRRGVSILGNIQDITERKRAESALSRSREALRRLSAKLLKAQEDERKRVARELHDSVGQSLSAIKFVVERALDGAWPNERRQQLLALQSVVPTIQASVEEVRRIYMALRPSTLDDLGLLATVAWFSREFQATHPPLRVEASCEVEESEVPEALKTVVFRILQEALNNVAKHSGARQVTVDLRRSDEALELEVRDDGTGFDPGVAREEGLDSGLGLTYMRERAELSGGVLAVQSAVGKGTTITARWPLGEEPTP